MALDRDVIFMATADEEAGGYFGVGWLVEQRPELFADVGWVLNEGGGSTVLDGRVQVAVEVTQKVPYWLRLTAVGQPGHGSRPREATAVTRLVAALDRLRAHEFEARIVPAVDTYFRGLAPSMPPAWRGPLRRHGRRAARAGRGARHAARVSRPLRPDPQYLQHHAAGRERQDQRWCRPRPGPSSTAACCPDQDPQAFLAELGGILGGDIAVETQMGFTPAVSSSETGLFRLIEDVTRKHFPGAAVVPSVIAGFTDSHFLRDLDITAYGYSPFAIPLDDRAGVHGNDERLSIENVRRGVRVMSDVVRGWAAE